MCEYSTSDCFCESSHYYINNCKCLYVLYMVWNNVYHKRKLYAYLAECKWMSEYGYAASDDHLNHQYINNCKCLYVLYMVWNNVYHKRKLYAYLTECKWMSEYRYAASDNQFNHHNICDY